MASKYRKKPVVIEAMKYGPYTVPTLAMWEFLRGVPFISDDQGILIPTPEGTMRASVGDWIIKGVKGEFYPCKADIFEATYELVESDDV